MRKTDDIKQYRKDYYLKNKDRLALYKNRYKIYFTCNECGHKYLKYHLKYHLGTLKHKNGLVKTDNQ
jgi:hypothetical protein